MHKTPAEQRAALIEIYDDLKTNITLRSHHKAALLGLITDKLAVLGLIAEPELTTEPPVEVTIPSAETREAMREALATLEAVDPEIGSSLVRERREVIKLALRLAVSMKRPDVSLYRTMSDKPVYSGPHLANIVDTIWSCYPAPPVSLPQARDDAMGYDVVNDDHLRPPVNIALACDCPMCQNARLIEKIKAPLPTWLGPDTPETRARLQEACAAPTKRQQIGFIAKHPLREKPTFYTTAREAQEDTLNAFDANGRPMTFIPVYTEE